MKSIQELIESIPILSDEEWIDLLLEMIKARRLKIRDEEEEGLRRRAKGYCHHCEETVIREGHDCENL